MAKKLAEHLGMMQGREFWKPFNRLIRETYKDGPEFCDPKNKPKPVAEAMMPMFKYLQEKLRPYEGKSSQFERVDNVRTSTISTDK